MRLIKSCSQVLQCFPKQLYKQETEWTCSIACIRSILSNYIKVPTEQDLILHYNLLPHAYFSNDIKELNLLNDYDVVYGCDMQVDFDYIIDLIKKEYYIMLESCYELSHWLLLLGYIDFEEPILLLYDPYYNEVKQFRVDEFITMWQDGIKNIKQDFIAIRE